MARCVPLVIVLVTSTALAQPKQRPSAARVPTRAVPCVPADPTLHSNGTDAVVCWDKGCMKLDFSSTDASWIVKPPPPKTWMIPQADVKEDQVCLGSQCKKFGKKLVAAIAAYKQEPDRWSSASLKGTSDLKTVAFGSFGSYEVWSVASDSKLKLPTPKLYAKTGEKPAVLGIDIAGDLLVVAWSACAGPCTKFSITDSSGRPKGPEGDGGAEVFQLDAKRFAVVSEYATIALFELGTAKPRGIVQLGATPEGSWTVRGDDTTIFSMYRKNDGMQVVKVNAYDDKSLAPSWDESMYLPSCTP